MILGTISYPVSFTIKRHRACIRFPQCCWLDKLARFLLQTNTPFMKWVTFTLVSVWLALTGGWICAWICRTNIFITSNGVKISTTSGEEEWRSSTSNKPFFVLSRWHLWHSSFGFQPVMLFSKHNSHTRGERFQPVHLFLSGTTATSGSPDDSRGEIQA